MKRFTISLCTVVATLAMTGTSRASIGDFDAESTQFGYQGTVQDVTANTSPVTFASNNNNAPLDGSLYYTANVPSSINPYGNYNDILSNWYQSLAANQPVGFFQLADVGANTVTSAVGGWTQEAGGLWDFTLTVTGANATADNSTARLWQPNTDISWGGTFNTYTYTINATGMTTQLIDGWLYNSSDPTSITGSFSGTFVSTQAVYGGPTNLTGDTYDVNLSFSNTYFDPTNFDSTDYGAAYSTFGAPIPEPCTFIVWSLLGSLAIGLGWWRKRKAA